MKENSLILMKGSDGMKCINKKGFTLLEMLLTIAIALILTAAGYFAVKEYINEANAVAQVASQRKSNITLVEREFDSTNINHEEVPVSDENVNK